MTSNFEFLRLEAFREGSNGVKLRLEVAWFWSIVSGCEMRGYCVSGTRPDFPISRLPNPVKRFHWLTPWAGAVIKQLVDGYCSFLCHQFLDSHNSRFKMYLQTTVETSRRFSPSDLGPNQHCLEKIKIWMTFDFWRLDIKQIGNLVIFCSVGWFLWKLPSKPKLCYNYIR